MAMWNKAVELRKEVQMNISPIWCAVKRESRSGWTLAYFLREAKLRYYRACKSLSLIDLVIGGVPIEWTTGAWEVFLRFGVVGTDEPWFKSEVAPRTPHGASGTSDSVRDNPVSRVEMKRSKKELAKERKQKQNW